MLNALDDFPVHQTPEPLAHPATSERNSYDRTWFNGYADDGSYFFGIGLSVYPHRQIQDCAFSVVRPGGPQHCFFGSRRAPHERTDMTVGPFRMEVVEPLRKTRVILEDNDSPLSCDLTFTALTPAIEEKRQTLWSGSRRMLDATRFDQFGHWEGRVELPGGGFDVDPAHCHATKDRSWGQRPVGERATGGATATPGSVFFLWAPLFWEDHVSHGIFFDGPNGEALAREGLTAPLYSENSLITDPISTKGIIPMATAAHRVVYHKGTRLARYAELDLIGLDGAIRTIHLEPTLRFQMKGLGYGHPKWNQGNWQGELATGYESIDLDALNLLSPENIHVQQLVKASDGDRTGIGVLEQIVIGPYAPAGFSAALDGASP